MLLPPLCAREDVCPVTLISQRHPISLFPRFIMLSGRVVACTPVKARLLSKLFCCVVKRGGLLSPPAIMSKWSKFRTRHIFGCPKRSINIVHV